MPPPYAILLCRWFGHSFQHLTTVSLTTKGTDIVHVFFCSRCLALGRLFMDASGVWGTQRTA